MRANLNEAHEYLEKPAMRSLLPDLHGKSVLCVGCGTGEECSYLHANGAKRVVGIDAAEKMIALAQKGYPEIEFYAMDMEEVDFEYESFDFVYSSLALHYVEHPGKTLKSIFNVIRPGGHFLFSTHHPIFQIKRNEEADDDTRRSYFSVFQVDETWFGDFDVSFYHRPFDSIINAIIKSGFQIVSFMEPQPLEEMKKRDPKFYRTCSMIPPFMIFLLRRPQ